MPQPKLNSLPKVSGCCLLPLKLPVLLPPFPSSPLSSSFRVPQASRPSTCREKHVTNNQGTSTRYHISGHVTEPGVTLIPYLRCEADNCWLLERAATTRGSRRGTRALVRGSRAERRRAREMWSTILGLSTLVHYWLHSTSDFMKRRIQFGAKSVWKVFLKGNFLGLWLQCGSGEVCPGRAENNECPVCCRGGSPRETEMILSAARAPLPSTKPQDHFLGATHRNVVNQKVSLALITRLVSMKWTLLNVVLHVLLQMFWVASADLLVLHNLGSFLLHFSYDYFVYLSFYSLSQLFLLFSLFRLFAHLSRPWSIGWVAITFFVCFSLPSLSRYGDKQLDLRFFQYIQA